MTKTNETTQDEAAARKVVMVSEALYEKISSLSKDSKLPRAAVIEAALDQTTPGEFKKHLTELRKRIETQRLLSRSNQTALSKALKKVPKSELEALLRKHGALSG